MATHNTLTSLFGDIADAIRAKTGENRTLVADEFPDEIAAIPSGGGGSTDYFWIEGVEDGTVGFTTTGTVDIELQYSYNKITWTNYTPNNNININAGQKIYWKNNKYGLSKDASNYVTVSSSNKINVGGRINSLINNMDGNGCPAYSFYKLFTAAEPVDASELILNNFTTPSCYDSMFYGCTNLVSTPELPATTLADHCYSQMFRGCSSLITAPELPATTLYDYCYSYMFYGCTSLTTTPELPATTLDGYCYQGMFCGCTALTAAPELPATTLDGYCYNEMFKDCTALTTAPELPATTLKTNCYASMFEGCSSLTTAPELPATTVTTSCYYAMFSGCTSLTTAPALPSTAATFTNCYAYMFYGCTSLTTAPELSFTQIGSTCCSYMFALCTSLTTVPVLKANSIQRNAYQYMFYGCTSLKVYSASGEGHDKPWRIPAEGVISTSTYAQTDMFSGVQTDSVPATFPCVKGQSYTYYTQNTPV